MRFRSADFDLRWIGIIALLIAGCITHPQNPAATQPATAINPATTQPSYWLDQPDTATVSSADFDKLWHACEDVARDYLFKLDREDYRMGVLTTVPMVSKQWFEPWRSDALTFRDLQETSIATIRRSIRFEFTRNDDQTWRVSPKILVERQALSERRVTVVALYRGFFRDPEKLGAPTGSPEADEGLKLPRRYWYPIRRDAVLERAVAHSVEKRVNR